MVPSPRQLFVLGLAVLLCGACGRERETASDALVDQALEANARQQSSEDAAGAGQRTLTLETEAGLYSATSGEDLPLPDDFPADVALPEDARITTATRLGPTISLGLYSPRSPGQVFEEFRRAQRAAGWTETSLQADAAVRVAGFDKNGRHLESNVVEDDDGSTLTLSVGPAAR